MGLRGDEAVVNKFLDREVRKLLAIIGLLENSGQVIINNGLSGELSEAKKKELLNQIKQSAIITDGKVKEWLVPAVSGIYVSGLNHTDELVKKFGIKTGGGKITVEILKTAPDLAPHLAAVNSLMSDAYLDFGSGMTGWIKGNEHLLNEAIRKQVQSKIALGRLTGQGAAEVKREVRTMLEKQGLQALIDRGGHEWTLSRYSEMLGRTHIIKANNEASTNRMREFEVDIVEVTDHGATDEICSSLEGEIFSLSGDSSNYPKLEENPPFHPNCTHNLIPRPDLD